MLFFCLLHILGGERASESVELLCRGTAPLAHGTLSPASPGR